MNKHQIIAGLTVMVFVQVIILLGMLGMAAKPLWTGQEIRVETIPVDPRSLFRGNYARLRYPFSTLPADSLPADRKLRANEPVFVSLEKADDGLYHYAGVSLLVPESGIYIKGRLQNHRARRVLYGLEAWFAPKEEALRLERELREGAVAVLMVDSNGKAALKDIVTKGSSG